MKSETNVPQCDSDVEKKLAVPPSSTPDIANALLALILIACIVTAVTRKLGFEMLPEGPGLQNARATRAIIDHGTVEAPEFRRMHVYLQELSRGTDREYWQDMYSIGKYGQLLPKHSLLTVFLSMPFYLIFGDAGFWLLNLLAACLILYSIDYISRELGHYHSSIITLCTLLLGTQTALYLYSYSYDLIAGAIVISGLAAMRTHSFWGALALGMSIYVRLSHVLLLPFLIFAWPAKNFRSRLLSVLGISLAIAGALALNRLLYGSCFVTAYHRLPMYRHGAAVLQKHSLGFSFTELVSDWSLKLFSPQSGFLLYNAILPALPFALWYLRGSFEKRFLIATSSAALLYSLFIFSYPYWRNTAYGNRFLFPALVLLVIPLVAALQEWSLRRSFSNMQTWSPDHKHQPHRQKDH